MRLRRFVVVLAAVVFAAGCVESDPPALDGDPSDQPSVTSDTLPPCSSDSAVSTSPAGCLDSDGNVVRG